MRVVSLVPSWTETLLECGVNVVGRTRFCVHPSPRVGAIPVLGGTKDLDAEKLGALQPDLLLLDREENLPWMAERAPCRVYCSHVRAVADMPKELEGLASLLANGRLASLAGDWKAVLEAPPALPGSVRDLPGVLRWLKLPEREPERLLYLIWRGPWMSVSRDTFIGSMLARAGFGERLPLFPERYPEVDLADFDPAKTLLLFSSEPYPFGKKAEELLGLDFPSALVDGEKFSWFGLRSLRFLQGLLRPY